MKINPPFHVSLLVANGAPGHTVIGKKRPLSTTAPASEPVRSENAAKRQLGVPFTLGRPGELAPVHLDVGGRHYTTSLATLKAVPGSRIYNTFTGRVPTVLDKKTNCYFIDRDGDLFRYVLEYLRNGALILPDDFTRWEQLENEAAYWELNEMKRTIVEQRELFCDNQCYVIISESSRDKGIRITGVAPLVKMIASPYDADGGVEWLNTTSGNEKLATG